MRRHTLTTAVLVDNPIARMGLKSILESIPKIKVIGEATRALEAFSLVKTLKPQLVFMDVQLSNIDNIEIIKKIALFNQSIKIIIISTATHPSRLIEAGAFSYISKNSSADNITHALRIIATGKNYLMPVVERQKGKRNNHSLTFDALSLREFQIAQMLIQGQSVQSIAKLFFIDITTIIGYRHQILKKLRCHNDVQLVLLANKWNLLNL
ncbi:MAG: uvrY [Gammaproteobacteria bacterium]|jgi:DNA-binding NarL/FixJ family response regulator|nr:uvrY [Gammaproteobacteria bacterium]